MNKRPLLLLICACLTFLGFGGGIYEYWDLISQEYDTSNQSRELSIETYARIAESFSDAGKMDELRELVDEARVLKMIDFYVLQKDEKPIWWGTYSGKLDGLDLKFVPTRLFKVERSEDVSFMTLELQDGSMLTMGINKDINAFRVNYFKKYAYLMIKQIFSANLIVIFVFLYFIKDIVSLVDRFRVKGARSFEGIKTNSREAELFMRGLSGYEEHILSLKQENTALATQVLPSLKKEILSGKKPPYDFDCTLVRTDINNFSHIYNTHDVTTLMGIINQFFTEATHVISRYSGLVHEFVGDEIIFYFKDEDHDDSFVTALSAIRDIGEIATRFNRKTLKEQGYPFTVKSSLAHGRLRFGPLVNGYSIAGSTLIETVRILAHVKEKEGNVVYFDDRHSPRLEKICAFEEATRVQMKGFSGERRLMTYQGHKNLADVMTGLSMETAGELYYYGSDQALVQILRNLRDGMSSIQHGVFLRSVRSLRRIRITQSAPEVTEELCLLLEALANEGIDELGASKTWTKFSSAVMLVTNLVPKAHCNRSLDTRLSRFLGTPNRRAVANLLEALSYVRQESEEGFFEKLFEHEDNRVAANALVQAGQVEVSARVIKQLKRMLVTRADGPIASALYAIGEIAKFHHKNDPVYFNTQTDLLALVEKVPDYVLNESQMVRRQALLAIKKVGDSKVVAEVWSLATEGKVPKSEVEEHLGLPVSPVEETRRAA